jgi:RNA polymerase sigma factor (sigma-70 family)
MRLLKIHNRSENESELVAGCIRNDRVKQKCLFDQYKNAMYTTALRIVGNSDIAQDILQDAFIDIFENIADFRFESTLGTWIKTIVIRKALHGLKLEHQHESIELADRQEFENKSTDFTAYELERAIQSLPESARAVFLLIEVEGYKHQEVAEMLEISIGTSKSQLNYSKKLLQKRLNEKL